MFRAIVKHIILVLLLIGSRATIAQELNCKVTVMHDKITGVDPSVFTSMQKAITDFMNNHKWTTDEFNTYEKIDVNILINLTSNKVNGDNDTYGATFSIQAARPVYNTTYSSTLINYLDRDITFKFTQFNTLQFDDNTISGTDPMVSNLTAILGYYAYLVIGLDYDSFAPDGGTTYLKKAQNVVLNAPDQGKSITGWKAVDGTHNRYWITDELMNNRFHDVRAYWYTLHREGLDSMYTKPNESRSRILTGLKKLYQVNRENPSSVLIQFFFSAKSDEILHILAGAPKGERNQYITVLTALDVPNSAKYNSLK